MTLPLHLGQSKDNQISAGTKNSSVALPVDEGVLSRNGCQFLKRDGFFLPMHKFGQQKTSVVALHHELTFADYAHEFDARLGVWAPDGIKRA